MKHNLKRMYTEMILDSLISEKWIADTQRCSGVFESWDELFFKSITKKVGKYKYRFKYVDKGVFVKKVHVFVSTDDNLETQSDTLYYSIFSKIYWRLYQLKSDHFNSEKMDETKLYLDTYKGFKEEVLKRDIKKCQETIDNLTKIEAEYKKKLELSKNE